MNINREKINSLLLIIYLFIFTLTIPLKEYMDSGASVWVLTAIILFISIYINRLRVNVKLLNILFLLILLILINLFIVDYKNIVLEISFEFIKFGLISFYLASQVTEYKELLRYWYYIGIINFFILVLYVDLVIENKISYMSFGTNLTFSFIIFSIYFYKKRGKVFRLLNLLLMTGSFILIFSLGNRSSALVCLLIIVFFELKKLKTNKIFVSVAKVIIIASSLFYFFTKFNDILLSFNSFINRLGINSYSLNKFIMMSNDGVIESSSGRDDIYNTAIEMIKNSSLLPRGLGYYQNLTGSVYPHNILLDSLIVFGIFSLPLITYIIYVYWTKYISSNSASYKLVLIMLGIYCITRLSFSGTFISEVPLWIILGLLIRNTKNENVSNKNLQELSLNSK